MSTTVHAQSSGNIQSIEWNTAADGSGNAVSWDTIIAGGTGVTNGYRLNANGKGVISIGVDVTCYFMENKTGYGYFAVLDDSTINTTNIYAATEAGVIKHWGGELVINDAKICNKAVAGTNTIPVLINCETDDTTTINCPLIESKLFNTAIACDLGNVTINGSVLTCQYTAAIRGGEGSAVYYGNTIGASLGAGVKWAATAENYIQITDVNGDALNIYMGDAADVLSGKLAGGVEGTYDPHGGQSFISGCSSIVI